jgi:hypothetical protein
MEEICDDFSEHLIERILIKELVLYEWLLSKAISFLKMVPYRLRYLKKRASIIKIQSLVRMKKAKKYVK